MGRSRQSPVNKRRSPDRRAFSLIFTVTIGDRWSATTFYSRKAATVVAAPCSLEIVRFYYNHLFLCCIKSRRVVPSSLIALKRVLTRYFVWIIVPYRLTSENFLKGARHCCRSCHLRRLLIKRPINFFVDKCSRANQLSR